MENRVVVDEKELRAFGEFCLKGETRTLQKDLDAAGGFMVLPQTLYGQVIHDLDNAVHIRKLAKIFRVNKADGVGVPVMDTDISDPDFTGEITEASLDTSMDFERRDLKPNRLVKGIKVSRDLLNLSTPDAAKFIMGRGTYKLAVAQENAFLNGSGAALNPLGIFTTSDLGVSADRNVSDGNTNTAITADGLINCMYNLKAQYLSSKNCRWIFHRDGLKMIRKLKDGEGNYLWQPGIGQDRPSTILGIPYLLSEYAPNTFTSGFSDMARLVLKNEIANLNDAMLDIGSEYEGYEHNPVEVREI